VPLDVFFEVAPGVGLFPETSVDVGGGIGIRYYFGGDSPE
jgi:diaminopimelate decarboxylase